jgi:SpoVK/Ycf46/Vps4 family AAA+-type ATPase
MPVEEFEAKFRPERDFFSFKSVIGLNGLKGFLKRGNRAGIPDRAKMKGVLLVGVPGTGKSFIMKCAAGELGMPLSEMSAANLYSKWLGETDKNLRKMLSTVEQIGGILGIDEYQRFMPTGSSESEGRTSQSVAGGMLTWQNDQNSVLVLAAANDVSAIPPEFTRSGRFDTTYFVGFPSRESKDAAWEMYISRHELDEQKLPTDDYWTPADIEVCCKMSEQQGISLCEAAKYIKVTYSGTGKAVLDKLMDWAEDAGCVDAETNELFVHPRKQKSTSASSSKAPKRTVRRVSK